MNTNEKGRGYTDGSIELPQTLRNREIAEKVDALLKQGLFKTRRGARKHIQRTQGRR